MASIAENMKTAAVEPLLDTDNETAKILGVGRTTVWGLMKSGDLEYVRIGRCRRIVRASTRAYVERLRESAR